MLVAHVFMSLIIGIFDVRRIVLQDQYFDTVPIGEIGDCMNLNLSWEFIILFFSQVGW